MAGTIEQRGKDTWRLTFCKGWDAEGKIIRNRKNIKASSRREAEKELAKFITEVESNQFVKPTKMRLSEYIDFWLTNFGVSNLAPTTINLYKGLFKRIILAMGHLPIDQIKPLRLIQFYKNLEEDGIREDGKPGGLSPQRILHHHRCISALLQDAVEWHN